MQAELATKLSRASVARAFTPEDVCWEEEAFALGAPAVLPKPVLSTTGLDDFSDREESALALHETAAMFSAFVRFEGLLNRVLADEVRRGDPSDPTVQYSLHIIEEEARHSRMFSELVTRIGVGSYPQQGLLGAFERFVESGIASSRSLFYLAMYGVEDITDHVIRVVLDNGCKHPVLRDVCRIHRIEEARHMQLARAHMIESYRSSPRIWRPMFRLLAPAVLCLIFDIMITPRVYARAGVARPGLDAIRVWWRCRQTPARKQLRADAAARIRNSMTEAGMIGPVSGRVWRVLGLSAATG